jgi:hypothetical protein
MDNHSLTKRPKNLKYMVNRIFSNKAKKSAVNDYTFDA